MKKINIDFLGIGAQKSATSWLHSNLDNHPDIWLPYLKELHYFDRCMKSGLWENGIHKTNEQNINIGDERYKTRMERKLTNIGKINNPDEIKWYEKYLYDKPGTEWYRSLFQEGEGKIKGEITPAYSTLQTKEIQYIKTLFPDVKLILLLRDPIERTWSQIRFRSTRFGSKMESMEDMIEFIESEGQLARSDYLSTLSRWRDVFAESQLFIGYYDEILESPKKFMIKLFEFLDLDPEKSSYENLNIKRNVSKKAEMSPEIRAYLIGKYLGDIEKLSEVLVSDYPKQWYEKYVDSDKVS